MNFQFYLEKLYASESFNEFIKENPDAYPCSGFFMIDRENLKDPKNQAHFDYYDPNTNKMFSFKMEEGVQLVPVEMYDKRIPEKMAMNYDFDFDDMEQMILDKMEQEKIEKKIQKLMFSLQRLEDKDFLVGTIFTSALGMLKVHIDVVEKKIELFEKKSLFDMVNVMKRK